MTDYEVEQLRDALADRDQELARVEARLEAVRKIAEREQRRSWVAGAVLAALSAAPQPQPARCEHGETGPHTYFVDGDRYECPDPTASGTPDDKVGCGCRQDPFCPHGDVVEEIAQPFPSFHEASFVTEEPDPSKGVHPVQLLQQPKPRPDMGLRDSQ